MGIRKISVSLTVDREQPKKNYKTKPKPSRKNDITYLWSIFTIFDKMDVPSTNCGLYTIYCDFEPLLKIAVSNIPMV